MKLWLLRPVQVLANNPWRPWWYDKSFGFVVRAKDEASAREIAHYEAGKENLETDIADEPWKDANYSTCVELSAEGPAEMVMRDFKGE